MIWDVNGLKLKMDFKENTDESFPLRGHLMCSVCGRNLTANKNRSRNGDLYLYYHCQDRCPERFRVDQAHESLRNFLQSITIRPEVKKAYMVYMEQVFIEKEGSRENEVRIYENKIKRTKELINSAQDKFFKDLIDEETYKTAKKRYDEEVLTLEQELKTLKESETNYMKYLKEALSLLENLASHFENASFDEKQKLLKILFPDKLIYKNRTFINPSKDGISLLINDIKEFEREGISGKAEINDLKVMM